MNNFLLNNYVFKNKIFLIIITQNWDLSNQGRNNNIHGTTNINLYIHPKNMKNLEIEIGPVQNKRLPWPQ